jgi:hypothetical protein
LKPIAVSQVKKSGYILILSFDRTLGIALLLLVREINQAGMF